MKPKKSRRTVHVDMGYGPIEHIVEAEVVGERICENLFDNGKTTDLLVEIPGGERVWVSHWV